MTAKPLRFEDVRVDVEPPLRNSSWWYVEDPATKTTIAIENPRLEADGDEDGTWYAPTYDSIRILENGEWREATEEESDDYSDDVLAWLRASDWER
jgi:hypothetical protein